MSFYQRVMRVCVHFSSDVCRRLSTRDPRVRVLDFFFDSSSLFWQKVVQFLFFFSFPAGLVEINVTHNVCVALDQPFPRINERNNPK